MPEAAAALAAGLRRIREQHGPEATLFLVSPRVSAETAWLCATLAKQQDSRFVFPAEDLRRAALPDAGGLSGFNISTAKQDDISRAEVLVTIGEQVCAYNPVFGFALRRAAQREAAWIHVGPVPAAWKRLVTLHVDCRTGDEAAALSAICGAVVSQGLADAKCFSSASNGQAVPTHGFAPSVPGCAEAARLIANPSKRAILVVNQDLPVGSDHADVRWAADLALLTGRTGGASGGLLVVKNEANGQGVQDAVYGGGFAGPEELARAQAGLRAGTIKGVVLVGVDPAGLGELAADLARAEFTAAIDLFPNTATARADVVVPLCPIQEEDGTLVSFDGRITAIRRVFKPLAGFGNLEFLAETLTRAGGEPLTLAATRAAMAAALPLYRGLGAATPAAYLCDQAAGSGAAMSFSLAPLAPSVSLAPYQSATTFSRVVESRLRARLSGQPVPEPCGTR
jgi:formate dehydrogenase major subunit